jgi:phosphatidate cytidylyltransferase
MTHAAPRPIRFADLGRRLGSGLVLAAVALANLWAGGLWMAALVTLALVLMLWEYHRMVTGDERSLAPMLALVAVAGAAAVAASGTFGFPAALACLAVGGMLAIVLAPRWGGWLAAGLAYMGAAMCALIVFRERGMEGALVILWLVLIVVAADVGAYFAGRTIGGPKLWPRVSPGKTWAGALGGLAFAAVTGIVFGLAAGWALWQVALLSIGVGVASQLGDLLESAVKRHFGVKDASRLIPGHGGVMDRLDGVMGGVLFFAICELLGLGAFAR